MPERTFVVEVPTSTVITDTRRYTVVATGENSAIDQARAAARRDSPPRTQLHDARIVSETPVPVVELAATS